MVIWKKWNRITLRIFIESSDTIIRRKNAINYFTNVFTNSTFKHPFYITHGLGNSTFDYLRYFIVNKDYEALENILFSPSPTSRLFAARTLVYLKEKYGYNSDNKTNERIQEVLANSKVIQSGILSCWTGQFHYDLYDIVKNFDEYLKTK